MWPEGSVKYRRSASRLGMECLSSSCGEERRACRAGEMGDDICAFDLVKIMRCLVFWKPTLVESDCSPEGHVVRV
jgi:hypothetical protein